VTTVSPTKMMNGTETKIVSNPTSNPVSIHDAAWKVIEQDPALARARRALSIHEFRLVIERITTAMRQVETTDDRAELAYYRGVMEGYPTIKWDALHPEVKNAWRKHATKIPPEEPTRNQAGATPSGVVLKAPVPRGSLPNSLGASCPEEVSEKCSQCQRTGGFHLAICDKFELNSSEEESLRERFDLSQKPAEY
jgi:hypothetical protein